MEQARLLVADDEPEVRDTLAAILREAGHRVDVAATGAEVLERVRAAPYDLLLQDLVFPPTDGVAVLREVKQARPALLVVIVSGHATVDNVIAAYRGGAFDFLQKPLPAERLLELAARAVEIRSLGEKRRQLADELQSERLRVAELRHRLAAEDPFRRIVGHSSRMRQLVECVREVARTDSTVLITGESGTGKGLVARTIHEAGPRAGASFVEANCVVYSEGVLHSELFGHEKGAFTGAERMKRGRFELARGGTLFLDEVGEISQATQLLLLRVLQERTFERVGGEQTLEAEVRLIAATNRDLQRALAEGTFRSDLYYRLNVIPVHMPALREHVEDVPLLAQHFLDACNRRVGRAVEGFTPEALEALMGYGWPGNVRELENVVERLVVLDRAGIIGVEHLPPPMQAVATASPAVPAPAAGTLQSLERGRILQALRDAGGNKKHAAAALGIHRSTLYAKLRRYGLLDGPGDRSDEAGRREERHDVSDRSTLVPTR
jgi:two-component system response regulator HydG